MNKLSGNIVAYSVIGNARHPLASADADNAMAKFIIANALNDHAADCKARGVPFGAKVVHECLESDGQGKTTFAHFCEIDPVSFEEIGEAQTGVDAVFNPPAKKPKKSEVQ